MSYTPTPNPYADAAEAAEVIIAAGWRPEAFYYFEDKVTIAGGRPCSISARHPLFVSISRHGRGYTFLEAAKDCIDPLKKTTNSSIGQPELSTRARTEALKTVDLDLDLS